MSGEQISFGNKKLGFGLMRLPVLNPDDPAAIDMELTKKMVDAFIEKGFTYFDTAWMYCGFQSENAAKEALVERYPRDSYTLATKLHAGYLKTKADRDDIFNQQLEKTGVEYFDYYLLHDIGQDHYEIYTELDCFNWLIEKKRQGLVRHIGFSYHDNAELLDRVLTEQPEMEFVQLQINYLDWKSEGIQSEKCYETAVKHGLPVIVMEPVKGGTLAQVPESVRRIFREYNDKMSVPSWAIRFAASLPNVKMVLSGMSNMEQLLDNTGYMEDFVPLSEKEKEIIGQAVNMINQNIEIACTGCSYCTDGCPMKIAIPKYFSLYNADKQEIKEKGWKPQQEYYERLTKNFGKASACVACGQCEKACPQHLPVIEHLKTVAGHFGS
ncbi:MAG: aldo/keto reductase [Clostridium sp.]|nr:aldo/keto reductase [Clostridium sp.]